jgi:uncharacterized membrane protein
LTPTTSANWTETTMDETNPHTAMSAHPRLQSAIRSLESNESIDVGFAPLERLAEPVSAGPAASVLRGEWLGHALHPLLTDFPLGCWISAGLLDLLGGRGARRSAQRLVGLGLLAVPPTAASGLSDWSTLRDPRTRRVGAVHAIGNTLVAFLYFRSWRSRRKGRHLRGVAYGLLGGTGAWATGYLGGHLSFARQAGTGERGLDDARRSAATPSSAAVSGSTDDLVDLTRASELIGVPVEQVRSMVDEGLLTPVAAQPDMRFRDADVRAVRLLGA